MTDQRNLHIGVMLPNWIGDVVMATPTLRALRHSFPNARLTGVMRPYVSQVLEGSGLLDGEILYDRKNENSEYKTAGVIRNLRRDRFDKFLLLTNSLRAAAIGWLGGSKERIGFVRNGRGMLLTERLYAERLVPATATKKWKPVPTIDYYLDVARTAGATELTKQVELATVPRDEQLADRVWQAVGFEPGSKVVVLNSGGARGAAKSWPQEYFVELARRILSDREMRVLILAGPAEMPVAEAIETAIADHRLVSMANPKVRQFVDASVSLGVAKALVRSSTMMITTDSGPRHFAHAFRVPVIALYGPNSPEWTVPYDDNALHVFQKLDCSFCEQRTCPLGHHNCMQTLTVDRVYGDFLQLMQRQVAAA